MGQFSIGKEYQQFSKGQWRDTSVDTRRDVGFPMGDVHCLTKLSRLVSHTLMWGTPIRETIHSGKVWLGSCWDVCWTSQHLYLHLHLHWEPSVLVSMVGWLSLVCALQWLTALAEVISYNSSQVSIRPIYSSPACVRPYRGYAGCRCQLLFWLSLQGLSYSTRCDHSLQRWQ